MTIGDSALAPSRWKAALLVIMVGSALTAVAGADTLSEPLSVAKMATLDNGFMVTTHNEVAPCAKANEFFLQRAGPNYDGNLQLFMDGWKYGKSVRAILDGCTNDGAGEVVGWQVELDAPAEFGEAETAAKSGGFRDFLYARVVAVRVYADGRGYANFDGQVQGADPSCASSTAYLTSMAFETATPGGQALLRTLTDAYAGRMTVNVFGKSTCDIFVGAGIQDLNYVSLLRGILDDSATPNVEFTGRITELLAEDNTAPGFMLRLDVDPAEQPNECSWQISYITEELNNTFQAKVSLAMTAFSTQKTVFVRAENGYQGRCRIIQLRIQ